MADSAPSAPSGGSRDEPDRRSPPGAPRWVKLTGVILLVLIVLLVVSKLAGVEHGPGRHGGSGASNGARAHAPPAGFPERGAPQR